VRKKTTERKYNECVVEEKMREGRWVDALPRASYIGKFRGLLLLTTVMSLSED